MRPDNLLAWPSRASAPALPPPPSLLPWSAEQVFPISAENYISLYEHLQAPPTTGNALRRLMRCRPLWKSAANLRLPATLRAQQQQSGFHCGLESYDRWLEREALQEQSEGLSRTFLVSTGLQVVGYYTLAAGSVQASPQRGEDVQSAPPPIPVAVLQQLAVDRSWQGLGLGRSLLWDALRRIEQAADLLNMRCILAEAQHSTAQGFLQASGFTPAPEDSGVLTLRLDDLRWAAEG